MSVCDYKETLPCSVETKISTSWGLDNNTLDDWLENDLKQSNLFQCRKSTAASTTRQHTTSSNNHDTHIKSNANKCSLQNLLAHDPKAKQQKEEQQECNVDQSLPSHLIPIIKVYSLLNSIRQNEQSAREKQHDKKQLYATPPPPSPVSSTFSDSDISSNIPKKRRGNNRPAVDAIVKRQRNTDAARRSRLRKVVKMETLENRVNLLKADNERLRVKVAVLEIEVNHATEKDERNRQRVVELEAQLAVAHKQLVGENEKGHDNNTSVSSSSDTITSISSSSTVCNNNSSCLTSNKPVIRAKEPVAIPEYSTLRKLFSKNSNKIYFEESQDATKESAYSFWGLKDASKENKRLDAGRSILLKWWRLLLSSTAKITQDEKSLYFEFILEIMARNEFLEFDFVGPFHYAEWFQFQEQPMIKEYRRLLVESLKVAIDKLNQKSIYSNFVSFSAKVLAICYFKVPGVSVSLLQPLGVALNGMKSLQKEMMNAASQDSQQQQQQQHLRSEIQYIFPSFLHRMMASDRKSYQDCLVHDADFSELPLSKAGNWKRRWESDDSELFFSFYRHYHAILGTFMKARYSDMSQFRLHRRNLILTVCPGYMCMASYFASKLHLLTQREICSVTNGGVGTNTSNISNTAFMPSTLSPMDNVQLINEPTTSDSKSEFNSVVGKPRPLVMATKRYAECMAWNTIVADPDGLYNDMVNVWLRAVIKRTVLTSAEQVFCLIDLLEQTLLELQKFPVELSYFPVDRPFILYTLNVVLSQCDHTIALLRALSFIYAHFQFLTAEASLLDMLCNRILMNTFILERLLLHWGKNVRVFFLRCLVWRVGRVWSTEDILWSTDMSSMVRENGSSRSRNHNVCNGNQCWLRWSSNNPKFENTQVDTQYELEIHIKLETLMASFYKHFFGIQDRQESQPPNPTVLEEPIMHFTSNLILLPPCHASNVAKTQSKKSNTECSIHQKSANFKFLALKKKNLSIRFDRKEFSKLFNNTNAGMAQQLEAENLVFSEDGDTDEALCNTIYKQETFISREIYATTNESSASSIQQEKSDQDTSQSAFLSSIINSWRYDHTKQVYAKMAIVELRKVVEEYYIWLENTRGTSAELASITPKLFLGWPKNWSFSI
ncbi:hypothetical protein [Parasitella parasitica]|uniref:BZIP domain-containing protein n=1 Tax=Parasitella parasitica TaxID=35722 RepID=A0A0B7N0M5_9FUNG|nr:hypothetical protein [Parasitella parasitica]